MDAGRGELQPCRMHTVANPAVARCKARHRPSKARPWSAPARPCPNTSHADLAPYREAHSANGRLALLDEAVTSACGPVTHSLCPRHGNAKHCVVDSSVQIGNITSDFHAQTGLAWDTIFNAQVTRSVANARNAVQHATDVMQHGASQSSVRGTAQHACSPSWAIVVRASRMDA
jgi:hypothetical protein